MRKRPRTHSHLEKERQSESPVALDISASERDPVGDDDTRADEERLEDKESTSKMGRGDLTVERKGDCQVKLPLQMSTENIRDVDRSDAGKGSNSDSWKKWVAISQYLNGRAGRQETNLRKSGRRPTSHSCALQSAWQIRGRTCRDNKTYQDGGL